MSNPTPTVEELNSMTKYERQRRTGWMSDKELRDAQIEARDMIHKPAEEDLFLKQDRRTPDPPLDTQY